MGVCSMVRLELPPTEPEVSTGKVEPAGAIVPAAGVPAEPLSPNSVCMVPSEGGRTAVILPLIIAPPVAALELGARSGVR